MVEVVEAMGGRRFVLQAAGRDEGAAYLVPWTVEIDLSAQSEESPWATPHTITMTTRCSSPAVACGASERGARSARACLAAALTARLRSHAVPTQLTEPASGQSGCTALAHAHSTPATATARAESDGIGDFGIGDFLGEFRQTWRQTCERLLCARRSSP